MTVALVLSHTTRWYAAPGGKWAHGARPEFSDLGHLGHWQLLTAALGQDWRVVDGPWADEELSGAGVVLLPLSGPTPERAAPAAAEAGLLTRHLRAGGGLLLFGDGGLRAAGHPGLPGLGGARLGERLTGDPLPDLPHVRWHSAETAPEATAHPVTTGVHTLHLHHPRRITGLTGDSALRPVVTVGGEPVAACGSTGGGRVAVVGNAEMFTAPFIGFHDNARFLANLLDWLRTGTVDDARTRRAAHAALHEHRYRSRPLPPAGDMTALAGDHVVDVTGAGEALQRVSAEAMPDPHHDPELFLREAELRYAGLPWSVRRAVTDFRHQSNDYGALLVRGLPVGHVPDTPRDPRAVVHKDTWLSELWLAMFAQALGSTYAYAQEKSGALFQNVVPTPGNADKLSSESSSILLDFHTEAAFHPFKPDYVMLLCLRPDHDRAARTINAGVRMVLPLLSARERAVLTRPLFRTGIDYSFGSANGQQGNGPVLPVLSGDPFDPHLTYDLDLMTGETEEAGRALQSLREAVAACGSWVRLDRGDLLVVDNRRAVHARSEFTPRYDGRDRWLQRMCVTVDIARSSAYRRAGSRVVETAFAL
ncbi:hypothetical protein GCM10010218_32490 [Streptomyces mashuensis]|uniref:Uncharacterized protein n=1 Tax=Streptomyces mashuensis TaxID=33904 RepID=A0A919B3V7_9ACTN|nr:DUF4350 domain-containing protein [Streptomyces mashuensis]GHF48508.1 hypothetical protein GCM10010218_32490 [Streptomyces mashuensis]